MKWLREDRWGGGGYLLSLKKAMGEDGSFLLLPLFFFPFGWYKAIPSSSFLFLRVRLLRDILPFLWGILLPSLSPLSPPSPKASSPPAHIILKW